jgi:hypothetical protein
VPVVPDWPLLPVPPVAAIVVLVPLFEARDDVVLVVPKPVPPVRINTESDPPALAIGSGDRGRRLAAFFRPSTCSSNIIRPF